MDLSPVIVPSPLYTVSALIGGFILIFGLISLFVKEKLFLSDILVALIFGILVGPKVLNLFNPISWSYHEQTLLELSKFAISFQVMAAGVSMPKAYAKKAFLSLSMLLGPTMLIKWLISGAIIYALLPLNYLQALLIAAAVTPTDPVLANSVVQGRFAEQHIPKNVRDILSAESGANDGLGLPYMYLALYLIQYSSISYVITRWVVLIWLYQILLAVAVGAIFGFSFRKLVYLAEKYALIDKESFLAFWIALALFLVGILGTIGSDDILACFVAGNAFAWDNWFSNETKEAHLQAVVDMLFNYAYFIYLGASLPWDLYDSNLPGMNYANLVGIAILIMLLRRPPVILLLWKWIPAIKSWRESLFAGWFGPIGVGAIFMSVLATEQIHHFLEHHPEDTTSDQLQQLEHVLPYIYPTVSFLVLSSVILHGITVPLLYLGHHVSTRSRSITVGSISNMVSRLPIIKPGQDIQINRNPNDQSNSTTLENINNYNNGNNDDNSNNNNDGDGNDNNINNNDNDNDVITYELESSSFPVITLTPMESDEDGEEFEPIIALQPNPTTIQSQPIN